jgi:hypothetical protein
MATRRNSAVITGYAVVAALAVVALLYQVFLVGLSLLGGQPSWGTHVDFGHMFGVFPLLLLILAYVGRLPGTEKRLNWLVLGVYIFQAEIFAFVRNAVPLYAALHPVLALVLFALTSTVAWRAVALARARSAAGEDEGRMAA